MAWKDTTCPNCKSRNLYERQRYYLKCKDCGYYNSKVVIRRINKESKYIANFPETP